MFNNLEFIERDKQNVKNAEWKSRKMQKWNAAGGNILYLTIIDAESI